MKIRNPRLIRALAWGGSWLVRGWMGTLRCEHLSLGAESDPRSPQLGRAFLYAFWHENILLPAYCYGRPNIHILISQHADGEVIAEICRQLKFSLVRGSTTRGGIQAVRQMLRAGKGNHLAITPDGPQGPRRQVQPGLIYLAARSGLAIVPTGVGYHRAWRMGSWDRFAVPRPWTHGTCVTGVPISIPSDTERDALDHYREQVEQGMRQVTDLAERWAATGERPAEDRLAESA